MKEQKPELYRVKLLSILEEAKNTLTFFFSKPDKFQWDEGVNIQLAKFKFDFKLGKHDPGHVRHLSIKSLTEENCIAITTRIPDLRSDFKDQLVKAKVGDTFIVFNPDSKMALKRDGKPIILISAGVSISTTRPLIRAFSIDQTQIENLTHINIDSNGEFIYQEEIESYAQATDTFSNYYTNDREGFYLLLEKTLNTNAIYYLVGSDQFIIAISKIMLANGIGIDSIILDKEQPFYGRLVEMPTFSI